MRGDANLDLMPSNLFAWVIGIALIVLAFEFGGAAMADVQALALGVVGATVAVALLLLSTNDSPPAQLVAVLFMENAIAVFESLLPEPWPLPVHGALSGGLPADRRGGRLAGRHSRLQPTRRAPRPRNVEERREQGQRSGHPPACPASASAPLRPRATPGSAPRWCCWPLAALLAAVAVFVRTPLAQLPLYFVERYFVLDATSMLFLLVINASSWASASTCRREWVRSPVLAPNMLPRAALTLAFMVAMNLGVMSNHLLLLWAFIELTTLCAAPLVAQGDALAAAPRRLALPAVLEHVAGADLPRHHVPDALSPPAGLAGQLRRRSRWPQAVSTSGDGWQRLGLALMLFGLGSKLGLAPLYGWMPETYEAAPTSTSALLAAVQFNISVVAVLRVLQVFRGQRHEFCARTNC